MRIDDAESLRAAEALRALPQNGERLYAILLRCDLRGELHKTVARDMNISRRQFYRDLAAARSIVKQRLQNPAPPAETSERELRLKTAQRLSASGHASAAIAHVLPLVESLQGLDAAWGHSVLADLMLDSGDLTGAEIELRIADAHCTQPAAAERGHLLVTRAKIQHARADARAAAASLETAAGILQSCTPSPLARDALAEALALLAFCHHEKGEFATAAAIDAQNLKNLRGLSAAAQKQYLNVHSIIVCDGPHGPAFAKEAASAYHAYAAENGFLDDVAMALLQMGGIARFERRLADAERLLQEALVIQQAIGRPNAPTMGMMSSTALESGKPDLALALARNARNAAPAGSHTWFASHLQEAEVMLSAGNYAEAQVACDRAANDADSRIASWRKRVQAAIHFHCGRARKAANAVTESIDILGRHAPPFHRLKALLAAEAIHRTSDRAGEIEELKGVLGWNS